MDSRAVDMESSVDVLEASIYCDAASATPQDDGFGGFVPTVAVQACEDGAAKLAGVLSKSLGMCNAKKASAAMISATFDLAACQATAKAKCDAGASALSGCPACLQASALKDVVGTQTNNADSSSSYCRNTLP